MIRAIGSFLRGLLPNDLGTALGRFLRVIGGAAIAAGIAAAINAVGSLPISTPGVVTFIAAALVALDKYFRNKAVY